VSNPLCVIRTIWRSRRGQPVSGCDYIEDTPPGGVLARVQVLTCRVCGDVSVGWEPLPPAPTDPREGGEPT
jgi:hypothetical protein